MEEERPKVKERLRVVWLEWWKSLWVENDRRIEKIFISLIFIGWEWKSRGMKKVSLNKFTHIPLIKNDAQKVTRKKKRKSSKFIKK